MHNCDGKISTSHTVGETTVHNFDGKLGTSQTVGNTTVYNLGNKLGTSPPVGTTTMHNFDGKFGWSQRSAISSYIASALHRPLGTPGEPQPLSRGTTVGDPDP